MTPENAIENFQKLISIYKGTPEEHEALALSVQTLVDATTNKEIEKLPVKE